MCNAIRAAMPTLNPDDLLLPDSIFGSKLVPVNVFVNDDRVCRGVRSDLGMGAFRFPVSAQLVQQYDRRCCRNPIYW
jgi:hypothetical protein